MSTHIIKHTHKDGEKLRRPTVWCGSKNRPYFTDLQHAVLAIEQGSTALPCKNCLKVAMKIIKELVTT